MRAIVCALVGVVLVVTRVLLQVRGVRSVEVSEDHRRVKVIADESLPPEMLIEGVRQLGYSADIVTP